MSIYVLHRFYCIIKQGDSDSEVIICFGTKFQLSVDLMQLLKVRVHANGFSPKFTQRVTILQTV